MILTCVGTINVGPPSSACPSNDSRNSKLRSRDDLRLRSSRSRDTDRWWDWDCDDDGGGGGGDTTFRSGLSPCWARYRSMLLMRFWGGGVFTIWWWWLVFDRSSSHFMRPPYLRTCRGRARMREREHNRRWMTHCTTFRDHIERTQKKKAEEVRYKVIEVGSWYLSFGTCNCIASENGGLGTLRDSANLQKLNTWPSYFFSYRRRFQLLHRCSGCTCCPDWSISSADIAVAVAAVMIRQ